MNSSKLVWCSPVSIVHVLILFLTCNFETKTMLKDFFPTWFQFQSSLRPSPLNNWLPYTCIDQLSRALKDVKQDSLYERVIVLLFQQFTSYKTQDASCYTHLFCLETFYQFCCWRLLSDLTWIYILSNVSCRYEDDVAALYMTASTCNSCLLLCFSWLKCWSTSWLSITRKWDTSLNKFWRNNSGISCVLREHRLKDKYPI